MARRVVLEELFIPEEGNGPPNLDIVLVHGIDGDPFATWEDTSTTPKTLWPRDLLPARFPRARVFSFGYNADMFRNNSLAGIRGNARSLLAFLELERDNLDSAIPIVFITHCLGGLIVKQALYFAEYDADYEDSEINTSTVLTVFFGTPNQGTHKDNWIRIAKAYSGLDGVKSPGKRSPLTEALLRESDELADINDKFRHLTDHYDITNFYETKTWKDTSEVIVGETDAQIGVKHEKLLGIDDDHVAMCQFRNANSSSEDPKFRLLCRDIAAAADIKVVRARIPAMAARESPGGDYATERARASLPEIQLPSREGPRGDHVTERLAVMVPEGGGWVEEVLREVGLRAQPFDEECSAKGVKREGVVVLDTVEVTGSVTATRTVTTAYVTGCGEGLHGMRSEEAHYQSNAPRPLHVVADGTTGGQSRIAAGGGGIGRMLVGFYRNVFGGMPRPQATKVAPPQGRHSPY